MLIRFEVYIAAVEAWLSSVVTVSRNFLIFMIISYT